MRVIALTAAMLFGLVTSASAGWRIDGNAWRDKYDDYSRAAIVQGFVEGNSTAFEIAPIFVCGMPTALKDCYSATMEALAKPVGTFDGVTYGQLRDGVNVFYSDYRNRKIELPQAMSWVIRSIRGSPAAELENSAEAMRKYAPK